MDGSGWNSHHRGRASIKRNINHTRVENDDEINEIFQFGRQLGQGSFGKVIEAVNSTTKTKFAVKSINKEKAGSAAVKLLEREVSILKNVYHKHVIHLEEVYETSKKMFLVMELCDNGGLDELLKKKVRFDEKETCCIMKQLADAVVYLHENNIVHRDLKLENILLGDPVEEEGPINIKITDFGLSYIRDGVGSDYMMQQVCGTPMYMAPEVITNLGYSERCDVWSCGVLMYYLLDGGPPFTASSEEELHELIKQGELNYTALHWDPISSTAKHLIEWMMRVDPARRCSAKEVLNDSWIQGTSSTANGPRLNVLDLMGEELMRQKLEKSSINNNENGTENENQKPVVEESSKGIIEKSSSCSFLDTRKMDKGKDFKRATSLKTTADNNKTAKSHDRRSPPTNLSASSKSSPSPYRSADMKAETTPIKSNHHRKTESPPRSVPSYMQPTKSSKAPKNPNTKERRQLKR
eukprot:gene12963-14296_t